MKARGTVFLTGLLILSASMAFADTATFAGTSGNLNATAVFSISGNTITITLTNTATIESTDPGSTLSGVYFDLTGNPALTPVSAFVAPGSTLMGTAFCDANPCSATGQNVGGGIRLRSFSGRLWRRGAYAQRNCQFWISHNGLA